METSTVEGEWRRFAEGAREDTAFFDGRDGIAGARAPGRLDILGGIADYSGSVVLEGTIAQATFAAVQAREDGTIRIRSRDRENRSRLYEASVPLASLVINGLPLPYSDVRQALTSDRVTRWAAYIAGCVHVLVAEGIVPPERATGFNIYVESDVPIGAGVSSSAALEVAAMSALRKLLGLDFDGMEMARLCQIVENQIVGAPCGIMDQVTCALGRQDELVVLKCQPHELLGYERVPPGWRFVGLDSGVKHTVGGSAYGRARVGAFMGFKILQELAGDDLGGYLCNVSARRWQALKNRVPETLSGADFTAWFGDLPDHATHVEPNEIYHVRSCAEHPILENERVREMISLMQLASEEPDEQQLVEAGKLLLEAHRSYSDRVDLGSEETDLIVDLAMERGPERGLYGAKITGGGSGGTVAILCSGPEAERAIEEIRRAYADRIGITPNLIAGSSPGAEEFGARFMTDDG